MKNKIILLLSILLILSGSFGLYWVKRSIQKNNQTAVKTFDPLLKSESELYKDVRRETNERVSSLVRESKKKIPAIRDWIMSNFDKENAVLKEAMLLALGNYKDKEALNFLISKIEQRESEELSFAALKGISAHEDVLRVLLLQKINLSKRSDLFLIHYHFSLFKTKSYFTDKKKDLHWLVEKGKSLNDSKELEAIVMGLSQHVPNFEKFHELLKNVLYKSKNEIIVNRAVIHLSVYDSGWLKVQTKNIISSDNEVLMREFLARSGAFCPLDIWKVFKVYAKKFDSERAIRMAMRVNMNKGEELAKDISFDELKLSEIMKVKTTTLCF